MKRKNLVGKKFTLDLGSLVPIEVQVMKIEVI